MLKSGHCGLCVQAAGESKRKGDRGACGHGMKTQKEAPGSQEGAVEEQEENDEDERERKKTKREAELRRLGSVLGTGSRYYSYASDHIAERSRRARTQGANGYLVDDTTLAHIIDSSKRQASATGDTLPQDQVDVSASAPRAKRRRVPTVKLLPGEEDEWEQFPQMIDVKVSSSSSSSSRFKSTSSKAPKSTKQKAQKTLRSDRTNSPTPPKQRSSQSPSKSPEAKKMLKFAIEAGKRLGRRLMGLFWFQWCHSVRIWRTRFLPGS